MRFPAIFVAALACSACGSSTPTPAPAPDRILIVDTDGRVLRQSTADENSRALYTAPVAQVWPAIMLAYADLGIEPTVVDRASGQYGNSGFVVPRRLVGRTLGNFFSCGSGLTGPLIDTGRIYANVVSSILDDGKGGTVVTTHVSATLRRNDGTSSDPITCGSTGALEEYIRTATEKRLAAH